VYERDIYEKHTYEKEIYELGEFTRYSYSKNTYTRDRKDSCKAGWRDIGIGRTCYQDCDAGIFK
jgi:hypothetical protein